MRRRVDIRDERGFVVPITVMILSIILLVGGVAAVAAIASLGDTRRDRSSTHAFELADGGVDRIQWHMNRQLTSSDVQALYGYAAGLVQTRGCLTVSGGVVVGTVLNANTSTGFCASISLPGGGAGESITCTEQLRFDVSSLSSLGEGGVLSRDVVCTGSSGGTKRRVAARLGLTVSGGNPSSLWQRTTWTECTSEPPTGSTSPTAGCTLG